MVGLARSQGGVSLPVLCSPPPQLAPLPPHSAAGGSAFTCALEEQRLLLAESRAIYEAVARRAETVEGAAAEAKLAAVATGEVAVEAGRSAAAAGGAAAEARIAAVEATSAAAAAREAAAAAANAAEASRGAAAEARAAAAECQLYLCALKRVAACLAATWDPVLRPGLDHLERSDPGAVERGASAVYARNSNGAALK